MIVMEMPQGGEDWLRARRGVVTASNFHLVLARGSGKTRRAYMERLAWEIVSGAPGEGAFMSEAMARGKALEPRAREAYRAASGLDVREVGLVFLDEGRRIAASPDGLIGDDGGLEIKCPLPHRHEACVARGCVPPRHRAQIQGNMWVSGRRWWDFVSFAPEADEPLFIRRVHRDEAYVDMLRREVARFLQELDGLVEQLAAARGRRRSRG